MGRSVTGYRRARNLLLGALGGGLGGFVFAFVGAALLPYTFLWGSEWGMAPIILPPLSFLCGAALGGPVALAVTAASTRWAFREPNPRIVGLAASFVLAVGYFLSLSISKEQSNHIIFNHIMPRTAQSLIWQYQEGKRDFVRWDLREADLSGVQLTSASLKGARLEGAKLMQARMWGADLRQAHLGRADLTGADLRQVHLGWADLTGADLSQAQLQGARLNDATQLDAKWRLVWSILNEGGTERNLRGADLRDADLSEADLRGADLREADLTGADLSQAQLKRGNAG